MPTFLFTDIENSTRLWTLHGETFGGVLARHDALLNACVVEHGGRVVKHTGDGLFAVFEGGRPLACAQAIQERLEAEDWGVIGELRVRVALNAGEAEQRGEDYFGPVVSRTNRLLFAGWGGQILLTPEAIQSAELPEGVQLDDYGIHILRDCDEPEHIFGLTHPNLRLKEFPPLRSLSSHPNNLPLQPTPFIGREDELTTITRLLENPDCRLLTLTGAGGIGKTRLALQAAVEQIEWFPHGVYYIPLVSLKTPDALTAAIADALKLVLYSREDPKIQVQNYLREKQILLVMDNFEHLLTSSHQAARREGGEARGMALLADLLAEAPRLKIIATSRERLNLRGEWLIEVRGMPFPTSEAAAPAESYSAVQLFLQSARRAHAAFSISDEDRPAISRICRLVEGIPLGIELAASWVRTLTCQEIAGEIEHNLDFLQSAQHDLPERHRSLRAVFDYSWALLSEEERRVLRKLAIFHGGFTWQAAAKIANASLLNLSAFVDKSLLRHTYSGRYEIAETMRGYASQKLAEASGERGRIQALQGNFYADFLQRIENDLHGHKQRQALDEIRADIENIHLAWEWALVCRQTEAIARCANPLYQFYETRGWFRQGLETFHRAARVLRGSENELLLAKLTARHGWFAFRTGDYDSGRTLLANSLAVSRRLDSAWDSAFALYHLASIHQLLGEYDAAVACITESLALYRRPEIASTTAGRAELAFAINLRGAIAYRQQNYAESRLCLNEALALFKELGNQRGVARALNNLGAVATDLCEYEEAKSLRLQSLEIYRQVGDRRGMAVAINNLSDITAYMGDLQGSRKLQEDALAIMREIGDQRMTAIATLNLATDNRRLANHPHARQLYAEAVAAFERINDLRGMTYALFDWAIALIEMGDIIEARQRFDRALSTAWSGQNIPLTVYVLSGIAGWYLQNGEIEQAAGLSALVKAHPETDAIGRERIAALDLELARGLSPDRLSAAREKGLAQPLDKWVSELLQA